MPRLGFAWLATPKTSVRGGYGLFYDVLGTNRITVNQVGYSRDTALTPSLDNGQTFRATLANPFPDGLLEPVGSALGLMTNAGLGVSFPYVGDVRNPRSHRWSIGLQRELPWQLLDRSDLRRLSLGAPSGHCVSWTRFRSSTSRHRRSVTMRRTTDCRSRCRTRSSAWCRPG